MILQTPSRRDPTESPTCTEVCKDFCELRDLKRLPVPWGGWLRAVKPTTLNIGIMGSNPFTVSHTYVYIENNGDLIYIYIYIYIYTYIYIYNIYIYIYIY